ncbi:MAG: hypothetical protein JO156_12815 [Solirubrobacterales bacterium]|nr:hypothetical protein [Solirubrobacterales bacterium]
MPANPAGVVYGTIAVGALLAAESARSETYQETIAAVAITLILYWLAHSYSELTARRLDRGERLTVAALTETMVDELGVLAGAVVPLLAVLACWVASAGLTTAVSVAVWTSAGMILVIELVIGVRAELGPRDLAAQTALGTLLGLLVLALRLVLH